MPFSWFYNAFQKEETKLFCLLFDLIVYLRGVNVNFVVANFRISNVVFWAVFHFFYC
jgi:hypothetical protein